MRWPTIPALLILLRPWEATAGSPPIKQPLVWLYDSQAPSWTQDIPDQTVLPLTARLIFLERLHLSEFNILGDVSESALRHLNEYAPPPTLFSKQSRPTASHLFAIIDGLDIELEPRTQPSSRSFRLSDSPTFSENAELLEYLSRQSNEAPARSVEQIQKSATLGSRVLTELADAGCEKGHMESHSFLEHEVTMIHVKCDNANRETVKVPIESLRDSVVEHDISATVLLVPQSPVEEKRTSNVYGTFGKPSGHRRERRQESILSEVAAPENQTTTPTSQAQVLQSSASPFPLSPQCYDSMESCGESTNNCTGHGECIRTAKGPPPSDEDEPSDCYQCLCNKPEVKKNADGTVKTTYFGGSACHKKDISAPFWLLTFTAGSLIALVGFGVSMLYAMGNAELPSVIGAGVSGPRAK